MRLTLICLLVLIVSSFPCFAQQSTPEDFKDFSNAFVGRWVGEVNLVTDWPGIGRKGEAVTGYAQITPIVDGKALLESLYFGNGSGSSMLFYDTGSKRIRWVGVLSGGTVSDCDVLKKGGNWVRKCTGSNPDGSEVKEEALVTVSDNGDTHTWTGQTIIGGKKADPLTDVWKRVSRK